MIDGQTSIHKLIYYLPPSECTGSTIICSIICRYLVALKLRGKESPWNAGDMVWISPGGRSPWRRAWQPIPIFLPGEFQGQRSLKGYVWPIGSQRVGHDYRINSHCTGSPAPPTNHTMWILLLLFPSFTWWGRKNLMEWKTLKIQFQLLQSIKRIYEMMFCNKTMELQIHALTHAHINTQLVETRKTYFFFQFKFTECQRGPQIGSTAVKIWSFQSSSQPPNYIHNFKVTIATCALKQA